jgi:uncharacterized delta-60 repeat protein
MTLAFYPLAFTPTGTQDCPPTRAAGTSARLSIGVLAVASLVLAFLVLCSLFTGVAGAAPTPGDPGTPNTTFNSNATGSADSRGLAVQPDGKIVVAADGGGGFLSRYNVDGTLDQTFGSAGRVTLPSSRNFGVLVQRDGWIVVVGAGYVRYSTTGVSDTVFNDNVAALNLNNPGGILEQAGGKLVVTGGVGNLHRLNANGTLDTSFGSDGTAVGFTDTPYTIEAQSDGKILVISGSLFKRYSADGIEDTAFNDNVLASDFSGRYTSIYSVAEQADHKIVIGCWCQQVIWRFNADGTPDHAFNANVAALNLDPDPDANDPDPYRGTGYKAASAIAIQSDGKIIIGGKHSNVSTTEPMVKRLNANGTLDAAFGDDGSAEIVGGEVWALRIWNGSLIAATQSDLLAFYLEGGIGPAFPYWDTTPVSEAPATDIRTTQGAAASVPLGPTNVKWTRNSVRAVGAVGASFDAAADTSYQITATLQSAKLVQSRAAKTVRGSCVIATKKKTKRRVTTCTIRLRKPGTWLVAITPLKAGILGTPTTKLVKVKKPAKRAVRILLARHA